MGFLVYSRDRYKWKRCELPVDGPNGEILIAEAAVSGKKKDAVVACALEACRLLDIHGLLHASKHESRKRKAKNWEDDDFYDSDEDTFLDRTGTIEKKRIFRMKKSGKQTKAETYESLLPQHEEVQKRIKEIEHKLDQAKAQTEAAASEEDDALEAYMTAIKAGVMDTKTRLALKRELLTLRTEEQRLRKLVNIAKPAAMPDLKKLETGIKKTLTAAAVTSGVRKIGVAKAPRKLSPLPVTEPVQLAEAEFQEEEEEAEDENASCSQIESTTVAASHQQIKNIPSQAPPEQKSASSKPETQSQPPVEKSEGKVSPKQSSVGPPIPAIKSKIDQAVSGKLDVSLAEVNLQHTKVKTIEERTVKGPSIPDVVDHPKERDTEKCFVERHSSANSSETRHQKGNTSVKKKKLAAPRKVDYDVSNPDYAMWLPPQDQSGDGRTKLNDKLGY